MAAKKTATAGAKLVKNAVRATARRATKSATKKAAADTGTAAKKATTTKSTAKKAAPAKKTTTTKKATTTKSTPAKKTTTKTTTKKATTKKAAPAKKATATKKSTATKTAPAKKTTTKKAAPAKKATTKKSAPEQLVVREDESPWTAKELKEVRAELDTEIQRLRDEISSAETDLTEFLKEPIDGAGDDQADAGAKSFEREHELSLVAGARTGLEQNLHALERLEDGTYGICESCGNPIGKLRLQAYPRATLCMSCKSTQERR